jgi:uncharacterized protein
MFLLAQERELPVGEQYVFRPYDYGPFSSEIYSDLDELRARGLVEEHDAPGYTWSRYAATGHGIAVAQELLDALPRERVGDVVWLAALKRDVLSMSFPELLRYVYSRFPDYAQNSIFTG